MDQEDLERRIAELERRLADAEAAAREDQPLGRQAQVSAAQTVAGQGAVDEHARRLTQALLLERERQWAQWRQGSQTGGPSVPEVAQLRDALRRAVVDAGLSQEQYKDTLHRAGLRAGGTVKVGGQVVYQRCDPADPVYLAPRGRQAPGAREFVRANRFGAIVGAIGGAIGLCGGAAAGVIVLTPSSALWMGGIVCISGYRLAHNQPGQSVSFRCVDGDSSYDVSDLAVFGLQAMLAALVLCVGLAGIGLIRARLRKP